ncbi:MAG: AMP-binding protein [Actinobacteria bacterium]|nr:AMP-binding protein [Actinomycetota bacterium]
MPGLSCEPLTPTAFLERSARVFGDRIAVIDGDRRCTYRELYQRCRRLAGVLVSAGATAGSRVAVLAPNTGVLLEAHYGVPLAGAVLVTLNIRQSPEELAYIVEHSGASVLLYDYELGDAARQLEGLVSTRLRLVESNGPSREYEELLAGAPPVATPVEDELSVLSINYTSGTTGKPKGVMYHHRAAYLQSIAMAWHAGLAPESVFLWTLPMFHGHGWCFTWAVTAAGGTHLCLRKVVPADIWRLMREEGVTHLCAAPTVLTMLAYHPAAEVDPPPRPIQVCTGGGPPSPALLRRLADLHVDVAHMYGMTESHGPIALCEWRPEWDALPLERRAQLKARQGVETITAQPMRVLAADGRDVASDGKAVGEVAIRGNSLMLGYYKDPAATERAAPDGWFRTGDLGVMHPDGYVEISDRAKDIIISGGENIASVEVENAVATHPAVRQAAVIAAPDEKWGEVPEAYVELKDDHTVTEEELIHHVRGLLAHFKAPRRIVFGPLPTTSTGKVQKFLLRDKAWTGTEKRVH